MRAENNAILDRHLGYAEDALSKALFLMPNEHDYYAIDTDLAALVDQVGQLRALLQFAPENLAGDCQPQHRGPTPLA